MTDAPDATLEAPVAVPASDAPPSELDLGYQVTLDTFSGPLDLLLFLVRRAEVDIADIPLRPSPTSSSRCCRPRRISTSMWPVISS